MDRNRPRKAALSRSSKADVEIQKEDDCFYQKTYHGMVKATGTWVENLIHSFQFTSTRPNGNPSAKKDIRNRVISFFFLILLSCS